MNGTITLKNNVKAAVLAVAALAMLLTLLAPSRGVSENNTDLKNMGLGDFVASEITYNGVMHEIYWHYELLNQTIRDKKTDLAKAHLKVLDFYINILPFLQKDTKYFKGPNSVKQFDSYAISLLDTIAKMESAVGTSAQAPLGHKMEGTVSKMCHHCHDNMRAKIDEITPYGEPITIVSGVDGFISEIVTFVGAMHEIYWHYEFSNQMIRVQRDNDAKAHLKIVGFYVDKLPNPGKSGEFFKTPEDSKKFDGYVAGLKKAVDEGYSKLGSGADEAVGKQMRENISKMCHHCHDQLRDNVREVTPYGSNITMGK